MSIAPQPATEPPPPECKHLSELADQLARLQPVVKAPPVPAPAVRAEGLLRRLDEVFLALDRLIERALLPALNPLGQLGAIANTCLIVAVVSGIALLFWYTPSVHQAYDSLELVRTGSSMGQLTRSLHRYSSDGCLLFILLHALRIFFQRRFTEARWLAWTTGLAMLALVWFIGWTGYWLVWDVRGQHAALGTAQFLDQLPLFAEPLTRSFLTNESVPSLLFFLVFFVHMLLPLAIGIGLWMHLMRVNRARFLAGRTMTGWIAGSLLVLSLLAPATSATPAEMTVKSAGFGIDWWYLWPLVLTDRLGGGLLWGGFLGAGLIAFSVPWWMAKRRRAPEWQAQVELSRCFGCTHCSLDCPFNAITMIPREDGKPFATQASVNPDLCVGCGICTGSCDSQSINLPALNSRAVEKRLTAWIDGRTAARERAFIAFCCGESAFAILRLDDGGRASELPDWQFERVPCVGWVSAVLLERLLQRGAAGVLVAACGESDPICREGITWFRQRLTGERDPAVDPRKVDASRIRHVPVSRADHHGLIRAAREFQADVAVRPAPKRPVRSRTLPLIAAVILILTLCGTTWTLSDLPYRTPNTDEPELVISFNHAGTVLTPRQLTQAELDERLPHMRAQVHVARERAPVRLRVQVDGATVFDESFRPKGLSRDGPSIGTTRLKLAPGSHRVRVDLADTAEASTWTQTWEETLALAPRRVRVVLFDTRRGFRLH